MFEKIYGLINGKWFPGIKTSTSFLFFFNDFWFYFIPDQIEPRLDTLSIKRKEIWQKEKFIKKAIVN